MEQQCISAQVASSFGLLLGENGYVHVTSRSVGIGGEGGVGRAVVADSIADEISGARVWRTDPGGRLTTKETARLWAELLLVHNAGESLLGEMVGLLRERSRGGDEQAAGCLSFLGIPE